MSVKFTFKSPPALELDDLVDHRIFLKSASDATVILVHGLTGTPYEMLFVARRLHKQGFTVLCPVLANHGKALAVLKKTRWQEFYQSVRAAFIERLAQVPPGTPIFVAGLSVGALLAVLLAEEFPEQVAGVIALSPTLFYDGWNVPWTRHLLPIAYHTPLKHFFYFKEESPYGVKNAGVRRRIHASYHEARMEDNSDVARNGYPYYPMTLICEVRLLVGHLKSKLKRVVTPLLLVQAVEDDVTSVRNSEFIRDRVSSLDKEIVLLHDCYHVITADQERETVAEKVAEFCHRLIAASAWVQPSRAEAALS